MIVQRHPAQQFACAHPGAMLHLPGCRLKGAARPAFRNIARGLAISCALMFTAGLTGCRHKVIRPPLPIGVLAPVDLESPAPEDSLPEIASLTLPDLGPLSAQELPPPPRRRPPPAPKENEQPPQIASNDASAALAIGALSLGGDDTTHTAQQAQDLINAVVKRIGALSSQVASAQRNEVRQAHNYIAEAQKALKTGDVEGAHTLATKARLLMDEIEKQ